MKEIDFKQMALQFEEEAARELEAETPDATKHPLIIIEYLFSRMPEEDRLRSMVKAVLFLNTEIAKLRKNTKPEQKPAEKEGEGKKVVTVADIMRERRAKGLGPPPPPVKVNRGEKRIGGVRIEQVR